MNEWTVSDDGVGIDSTRKELSVRGTGVAILVEYTSYSGEFTPAGRRLAVRLCNLLNEASAHACRIYAGQDHRGLPLVGLTLAAARKRAKSLGFKGAEAEAIARQVAGRK